MQWTNELDAQLNQCVFECGYDFGAAAVLLESRAKQLRLVSNNATLELSSDDCQVQWMAINPVLDDDNEEDEEEEDDGDQHEHDHDHYSQQVSTTALPFYGSPPTVLSSPDIDTEQEPHEMEELRPAAPIEIENGEHHQEGTNAPIIVPDGCPKLELSLSDADLDALLSNLSTTTATQVGSSLATTTADAKDTPSSTPQVVSEMQWVLSFLHDPDAIAHRDAEAKNLLFETSDTAADDDNYQYFLHQLGQANLLSPQKPRTATAAATTKPGDLSDATSSDQNDEDGEDDEQDEDEEDDWAEARERIKASRAATASTTTPSSHSLHHNRRRPLPKTPTNVEDIVLPPAAPIRFPPRAAFPLPSESPEEDDDDNDSGDSDAEDENEADENDPEDNGLDALPRFVASASTSSASSSTAQRHPMAGHLSMPLRPPKDAKLMALSHEIGHQLRQTGEFQFPKRLFHAPNSHGDHDQTAPQNEP